jgi:hypothetical protein
MDRRRIGWALAWTATAALVAAAARADVEDDLKARLRGRWGVTRVALASECTDHYTENTIEGDNVSGKGVHQFAAGERVTIDNVSVGWGKVDVNLRLVEPFRLQWRDGPFDLYDQRNCRVQLRFEPPREVKKDAARAEQMIRQALEIYASEAEAKRSPTGNGRRVEAYPPDWDKTRAAYDAWRLEQRRVEATRRLVDLSSDLQALLRNLPSDPEALRKWADGARSVGYESYSTCEEALGASSWGGGSAYDDGKRAARIAAVLRGLEACLR